MAYQHTTRIEHRQTSIRNKVTMQEFYNYRLAIRAEFSALHKAINCYSNTLQMPTLKKKAVARGSIRPAYINCDWLIYSFLEL